MLFHDSAVRKPLQRSGALCAINQHGDHLAASGMAHATEDQKAPVSRIATESAPY